jgi:Uroporphyrinogen-III synthase
VLVPRTKDQAAEMSDRLRAYGAVPVEVPTIAVEPPRSPAQMDRAVKGLVTGRYGWIVFTSVNAVKAVREKFVELGLDARAFAGVKVACVGESTADAVRAFGIVPELVPTGQQSSEGLLADFPEYDDVLDPIDRVLLPRADIATETLAAA